jgi:hypothetical protein
MKKTIAILLLFFALTSFSIHKFYVSIYQIDYAQNKSMLQITSRIFVDDLNAALKNKYNKETHLGAANESEEDVLIMRKYIQNHFSIKVNGKPKVINYLSKEIEANVLICYYNIKEIQKIKSIEIQNTALFELNSEQQNIIQTNIYKNKKNLLLTSDNVKGLLNQ